jgi:hypothetical protein
MRPLGLRPSTLVFPRNRAEYAYSPLLAAAGIIAVRHRERERGIRLAYPERTPHGVYKIYESMNLRIARHYDYLQKARIFLCKAIERRAAYSLWFHPSDPAEWVDPQLREILQYIADERRGGRLWVATMREVAAYCEAREQLHVAAEQSEHALTVSLRSTLDVSRYGTPEVTLLIPTSSQPRSACLELATGEHRPVATSFASDGVTRLLVNVPVTAKTLKLSF